MKSQRAYSIHIGRLAASGQSAELDQPRTAGPGLFILNASATEGAGQTADIKIQHSADKVTWLDTGLAFAQVTNAAKSCQQLHCTPADLKRYVRISTNLSAGAALTFGVEFLGKLAVA